MKQHVRMIWFKVAFLVIVAVIMSRKDISFTFNFNAGNQVVATSAPVVAKETKTPARAKHQEMGVFADIMPSRAPTPVPTRRRTPEELAKLKRQRVYVDRFAAVAVSEMKKYGIPASITLAQGLIETNAGSSTLASKHNNHFGIKCFSKKCKQGHCVNVSDNTHKDFFVRYETAWTSYRAHSEFLTRKRYRDLHDLGKDYKAWARGLKEAGYATDSRYADKLIKVIEDLELYKYDR